MTAPDPAASAAGPSPAADGASPPRTRRPRRVREVEQPRLSVLHVLDRVRIRLIDIQVWDVAGTMTFYTLLSLLPAAVAAVSAVSLLGLADETITAFGALITEIFPTVDPTPWLDGLLTLARSRGGVLGVVLGMLGALLAASNGVAAFHRALHRVYDTREGRPFLWFRTIVFGETVVIVLIVLLVIGMMALGTDVSQRIGDWMGIPRVAFEIWNLAKWPLLLAVLAVVVSLAYHLFPNVRFPRYRVMTLGSAISVTVLFLSAVLVGQMASAMAQVTEVITTLNSVTAILVLIWLANIVIVGGAALDAEFLRARQIARGIDAWDRIVLEPHATHSLDALARDARRAAERSRAVAASARSGDAALLPRSPWVVEAGSPVAVNPPHHPQVPVSTGALPVLDDGAAPASHPLDEGEPSS